MYASLFWKQIIGSLAVVESPDCRFTLKRGGFLHPHVTIREEGSMDDLAIFHIGLLGNGVLEFRDGRRRFSVTEKTAALDVVKEVGHGNTLIGHLHTTRNLRNEMFFRSKKSELYAATMSDRMVRDARETVRKILREHSVTPLEKNVLAKGDDIVRTYERSSREHASDCSCSGRSD